MDTFLDLLIVVVMALAAVSLVTMALMFLVKNTKVRRICLWIVGILGVYMAYVGLRILLVTSIGQSLLAGLMGLIAIGAIVLERLSKGKENLFLMARIAASVALVVGMLNAFVI